MSKRCVIKVLQILGDPTGGIRKHVHEIIQSSSQYNCEAHYIHGGTLDAVGKGDIKKFNFNGVHRVQLRILKKPHLSDLFNIVAIARYCRLHEIDIIHGHGAKGGIYCRLVGLLVGVPSIYTPHGGSVHASFGMIEGFVYRAIERMLKSITRLYLFESNYTFQSFVRFAGNLQQDRYQINYNGIDVESFSSFSHWLHGKDEVVNILVVGVLREIKGQAVAIHGLAKLQERGGRRYHLHFCGEGQDTNKLKTLVSRLNLESDVTFHGEVVDVSRWYEMCNIVVIPSLFESFGYVALEAALMRRPVIASDCGGLSEIVINGETGHLFAAGDIDLLSDKIIRVLQDVVETDKLVSAGAKRVKDYFNSNIMLKNIHWAYQSVKI